MKRTILLNTILGLGIAGLVGCNGTTSNNGVANANRMMTNSNTAIVVNNNMANMNGNMNGNMNVSGNNSTSFMYKAAQGGMAEVKMGELAASKAQNAEVKQFGQKMVTDHTKANTDLKAVAAKENVSLPGDVNADQKETMDDLSKLSGAEFDKEYVSGMVEDHEKDVADFQAQADSGSDPDVKAFAARTLPTLKAHLEMIKNIQSKMK